MFQLELGHVVLCLPCFVHVMGVGMCLYAQLVQTKNKQCKSAIVLQCYVSVVSADITICGKLFQTFTIMGAKENFLKS